MAEIMREPIIGTDENGDETVTFDINHSLADIARWIMRNQSEAEELHSILGGMLEGKVLIERNQAKGE
jgi:hypothetical protein